jgi:ATP-binding cassette subfamily C protein
VVGDRGVTLSGGQRQRLALARALLRKPALLILDEPTSELDAENEARIWAAINALHGTTTILVISHRLAPIERADLVHVIDDGQLVESGALGSLSPALSGRLVALWQARRS